MRPVRPSRMLRQSLKILLAVVPRGFDDVVHRMSLPSKRKL